MPSPFSCSPVIHECPWKKTQREKKKEILLVVSHPYKRITSKFRIVKLYNLLVIILVLKVLPINRRGNRKY